MARGFGSTFGVGATDAIQSSYAAQPNNQISVAAWAWVNGIGGGTSGKIIDMSGNGVSSFSLGTNNSTTLMKITGSTGSGSGAFSIPAASSWQHICMTWVLNGQPTVYVNGSPVTVTGTFTPQSTANNNYLIGNRADGTRNWDGKLADVGVWNGTILSANQVLALAKGTSPLNILPAQLSLYLPLLGVGSGEPDWSPAHATQTITGTKFTADPPINRFNSQSS